jgi:hypothetical protein
MKNKKIVIAGGTGFIGQELVRYFGKENNILILTRQIKDAANNRNKYNSLTAADLVNTRQVKWDGKNIDEWVKELDGTDIIINLAGKTVNSRYTPKNKREILESRINATKVIGEVIRKSASPPKLWINASSATIYRNAEDRPQDDYTTEFENDFSVQVCLAWEKAFNEQITPGTRKVALRLAITLGTGGVLIPYFNLVKFGLGGKQGSGKQMFSWVHIEDVCRAIEWIAEQDGMNGAYNCTSPNPVTNREFMRLLRKATGNKFGLPAFEWMLKMGAVIIGTETELILKSRWVLPTKILETGFQFKYPFLQDALAEIVSKVPRRQYHLF